MKDIGLKLYIRMQNLKDALLGDQSGQDLIEYALIAGLIAVAAITAMGSLAGAINGAFGRVTTALTPAS
jgi:pilus assembly protein Flp/PilA